MDSAPFQCLVSWELTFNQSEVLSSPLQKAIDKFRVNDDFREILGFIKIWR